MAVLPPVLPAALAGCGPISTRPSPRIHIMALPLRARAANKASCHSKHLRLQSSSTAALMLSESCAAPDTCHQPRPSLVSAIYKALGTADGSAARASTAHRASHRASRLLAGPTRVCARYVTRYQLVAHPACCGGGLAGGLDVDVCGVSQIPDHVSRQDILPEQDALRHIDHRGAELELVRFRSRFRELRRRAQVLARNALVLLFALFACAPPCVSTSTFTLTHAARDGLPRPLATPSTRPPVPFLKKEETSLGVPVLQPCVYVYVLTCSPWHSRPGVS